MFLVDKYTPDSLDKAFFHKDILKKLKVLSEDESIPHLIFYGPDGSGKKTIIKLFLEMIYDKSVHTLVNSTYRIVGSGSSVTNEIIKQSNYHIVIEPKNNNSDRYLIQEVVQEYAKRVPLNVFTTKKIFKTVLINNVDNLPRLAQTALRRTMEKYSDTCRFILWTKSLSNVIEPLISRCFSIRIPSPSDEMIFENIKNISKSENITVSPSQFMDIVKKPDGSIKKSLWLLQLLKYNYSYNLISEDIISYIISLLLTTKVDIVPLIRLLFYKIMVTNISEFKILTDMFNQLLENKHIPTSCKYYIIKLCSTSQYNLTRCRREILHLEYFAQQVIDILHKNKEFNPIKVDYKTLIVITKIFKPVKSAKEYTDKDYMEYKRILNRVNINTLVEKSTMGK